MGENMKLYKCIKTYVNNLDECYGEELVNIRLYNNLLKKTTNSHTEAISKHINLFSDFCDVNERVILDNEYKNLVNSKIKFTENVYLDMNEILEMCDDDSEKKNIWKHLQLMCSVNNPSINAKEVLFQKETSETNFLKNMMDKVESSVDNMDSSNPMEAITGMMSSGVFSELVGSMTSGLQSGDLNIGNLLGTVNEMVGSMNINDSIPTNNNNQGPIEVSKKKRNRKNKKLRRK